MPPFFGYISRVPMKADVPPNFWSSRPAHASRTTLSLVAMALLLAGCGSFTDVKVDSLAKPNAESAISYEIKNKNPLGPFQGFGERLLSR